ncbi:hypothetical protein GF420_15780 [candidate division GN15 bacterium]|nr:hypothetical protein [candidate division GN15 bacterium]
MFNHHHYPVGVTKRGKYLDFVRECLLTALDRWAKYGEMVPENLQPLIENDLAKFMLSRKSPQGENVRFALISYMRMELPEGCWGSPEKVKVWEEKKQAGGDKVYFIVTDNNDENFCANGEFGVEVNGIPYIYYKDSEPIPAPDGIQYRRVEKREFGEVIRPKS